MLLLQYDLVEVQGHAHQRKPISKAQDRDVHGPIDRHQFSETFGLQSNS